MPTHRQTTDKQALMIVSAACSCTGKELARFETTSRQKQGEDQALVHVRVWHEPDLEQTILS